MLLVTYKTVRKLIVLVVGLSIVLVGIAMIVLPGPAVLIIPLGLGILATEFAWAARLLRKLKHQAMALKDKLNANQTKNQNSAKFHENHSSAENQDN